MVECKERKNDAVVENIAAPRYRLLPSGVCANVPIALESKTNYVNAPNGPVPPLPVGVCSGAVLGMHLELPPVSNPAGLLSTGGTHAELRADDFAGVVLREWVPEPMR
eukprot:6867994-Pyramimonas_sp.AAC.1